MYACVTDKKTSSFVLFLVVEKQLIFLLWMASIPVMLYLFIYLFIYLFTCMLCSDNSSVSGLILKYKEQDEMLEVKLTVVPSPEEHRKQSLAWLAAMQKVSGQHIKYLPVSLLCEMHNHTNRN